MSVPELGVYSFHSATNAPLSPGCSTANGVVVPSWANFTDSTTISVALGTAVTTAAS